jgi:hypothetical protein
MPFHEDLTHSLGSSLQHRQKIMGAVLSAIRWWRPKPLPTQSVRQKLLTDLQGCTVVIPDLQDLFKNWPQGVNPEVGRLHDDVEKKLEM